MKKLLEVPVLRYNAATKIQVEEKAPKSMKPVENIRHKGMRQESWG